MSRKSRKSATKRTSPPNERPDAHLPRRVDASELGGESEDSLEWSGMTPQEREQEAQHERLHEEGLEAGPEDREDLAAEADDLGRRYLEDATQQPRRERRTSEVERESTGDEHLTTMGEEHIREMQPGASDEKDQLVTRAPDRTDYEERRSEETLERLKEKRLEDRRDSRV